MLFKLLKYDFRSMFKQFAFIWPAALLLAAVNRFTVKNLDGEGVMSGLMLMVYISIMIAMFVVTLIFVIQRFYRGLLGDEGYLMHTLPVNPWQLIASKLICSVVMTIISILVAIASILIICLVIEGSLHDVFEFLRWFWKAINLDSLNTVLFLAELLVLFAAGLAKDYLLLYLAMATGHLFNRNRIAMSVIAFIFMTAATSVLNPFTQEWIKFFSKAINHWQSNGWLQVHGAVWLAIAGMAAVGAVYFFITDYILRKKLNLE